MTKKQELTLLDTQDVRDVVKEWLANEIAAARTTLGKFAEKLDAHPATAFEWGMSAVDAAARIEVFGQLKDVLDAPTVVLSKVVLAMQRDVVRRSRYPSRSTSPLSNLMDDERMKVRAEFVDEMPMIAGVAFKIDVAVLP